MKGTPIKTGKQRREGAGVDGPWLAIPVEFLASRACAELSPLAIKMLLTLLSQLGSRHYGNGRLDAHEQRLRRNGWPGRASAVAALKELVDAGLVVCTRHGRKGRIGLYAIALFPMHCGNHQDLDFGPGSWATTEWRKTGREAPPTDAAPAAWARPRGGEKRKASARCGTESGECSPAAGQKDPGESQSSPAAGQHEGAFRRNAVPLRDSPLREPSVRATARRSARPAASRISRVLGMRVDHHRNLAHLAAVAALGLNRPFGNSAAAALFPPRPRTEQPERLQTRTLALAAQGAAQLNQKKEKS